MQSWFSLGCSAGVASGCGWWTLKMKNWDVIDPDELNPWMAGFCNNSRSNGDHLPIYTVVLSILYKVN
jgi:hypothetical protein